MLLLLPLLLPLPPPLIGQPLPVARGRIKACAVLEVVMPAARRRSRRWDMKTGRCRRVVGVCSSCWMAGGTGARKGGGEGGSAVVLLMLSVWSCTCVGGVC